MIITQTPLRISLLGGGTDFPKFFRNHYGCVLTTAIDKYAYCIVKERFDNLIYVNYSQKEIVSNVADIKNELVREALIMCDVTKGVEITLMADVPSSGSGLGSSSSFAVGILHALYLYKGINVDNLTLAKKACEIEIKKLKQPIGIQDQYIAAFGGINFIEFAPSKVTINPLNLSAEKIEDLKNHIMVFYTGQTRKAATVLTEQKKKISSNIANLNKLAKLAKKGRKLLLSGKYKELGELLDDSWRLKKSLASNITNDEINEIYKLGKKAGAYGGKISGAGNGGFMTFIVPPQKRIKVRAALKKYRQLPIGFSLDGSKSILNYRN